MSYNILSGNQTYTISTLNSSTCLIPYYAGLIAPNLINALLKNITNNIIDSSIQYENGTGWLTVNISNNDNASKKILVSVTSTTTNRQAKVYLKYNNTKSSNYITIIQKENTETLNFYFYTNSIPNKYSFLAHNSTMEGKYAYDNTPQFFEESYKELNRYYHVFLGVGKIKCSFIFDKKSSGYICSSAAQYHNDYITGNLYIFDEDGNNIVCSDGAIYSSIKNFLQLITTSYSIYYINPTDSELYIVRSAHTLCNFSSVTDADILSGKYDGSTDDKIYNK